MAWLQALLAGAFKSKTAWLAFATAAVSLLTWLGGQDFITANPTAVSVVGVLLAVAMLVVRYFTNKPLVPPVVDPNAPPEPSPAPDFPVLVWLRDILIALANKEIVAPAELKTLGVKLVEAELSKAEAQGSEPIPVPADELQKAIQVLHSRGINL